MNPSQTYVGRLVAEPELRYTPGGAAVLSMRVAVNDSRKNDTGEWENHNPLFFDATVWKEQAEQLSPVLHKGMRVLVQGKLTTRTYETKSGEKRQALEMQCFDVWLQPHRQQQQQQQQQRQGGHNTQQHQGFQNAPQSPTGGFGQQSMDEPPF